MSKSAFPSQEQAIGYYGEKVIINYPGLSKREYFAAMAMKGLLSNSYIMKNLTSEGGDPMPYQWIAQQSKMYADELLKQLDQ